LGDSAWRPTGEPGRPWTVAEEAARENFRRLFLAKKRTYGEWGKRGGGEDSASVARRTKENLPDQRRTSSVGKGRGRGLPVYRSLARLDATGNKILGDDVIVCPSPKPKVSREEKLKAFPLGKGEDE